MSRLSHRIDAINSIQRQYQSALQAIRLLRAEAEKETEFAQQHSLQQDVLHDTETHLEETFIIRMFAEFESTLRAYWDQWMKRSTRPPIGQLIDSVTPNFTPQDWLDRVHEVREYRNMLVHEDTVAGTIFTLAECHERICRFLNQLDHKW